MKADVAKDLPKKEEKVLFCKLTKGQVSAYQKYLDSAEVSEIMNGKRDSLSGISILRKICCHPDLVDREHLKNVSSLVPPGCLRPDSLLRNPIMTTGRIYTLAKCRS
jgi:DNA excision repair protein ERCC-6